MCILQGNNAKYTPFVITKEDKYVLPRYGRIYVGFISIRIFGPLLKNHHHFAGPLRRPRLLAGLVVLALPLAGQSSAETPSPAFPADRHRELREELSYDPPEIDPPREDPETWDFDWNFDWLSDMGPLLNVLALLLLLIPLGFFIYHLLGTISERRKKRRSVLENGEVRISEIEEEKMVMGGVALSLLERAENAGQFDVAVRLLYIRLLKDLNDRELIRYRKDYSNRDYRHQLSGHPFLPAFRTVTEDYERYWYGKYRIDRLSYRLVRGKFDDLSGRLTSLTVAHEQ